jgi:predicted DNA-binding transcriptional regulator YafY
MAGDKDSLYAQFTLLNYLYASRGPRTVKEILAFLQSNTSWGRAQLVEGAADAGHRNLQNWLKSIRESAEFGRHIEWQPDPANRKRLIYSSRSSVGAEGVMPIEEACTLLLAEKLLDQALPAEFYDAALRNLFRTARDIVSKYEQGPAPARRRVSEYLRRVAIAQRGQQLIQRSVPYDVLGVVAKAILEGKCIEIRYRGRRRVLHPYGLVIKSPKIYLLAVDDRVQMARGTHRLTPTQFLCSRIEDIRLSRHDSRVPAGFDAGAAVEHGQLDVSLDESGSPSGRSFTLELRIHAAAADNLLQDLEEFPLSRQQTIEREPGTRNHLLTARGLRSTHQLIEWIVGRLERVEVLAPRALREQVAAHIAAMHSHYT